MRWLFAAVLLSACNVQPGSIGWYETATPEEQRAYYETRCAGYGFKPGTDAMANCVADETRNLREFRARYYTGI